jgi:hypothetical protein
MEVDGRAFPGAAPGGQRRPQQLGGEDALHPALGSRDELHNQIGGRAGPGRRPALGLDRLAGILQGVAQTVERLPLLRGELGDQGPRIDRAVACRSTREADRRGAPGEPLERALGVGARQAGGVG